MTRTLLLPYLPQIPVRLLHPQFQLQRPLPVRPGPVHVAEARPS